MPHTSAGSGPAWSSTADPPGGVSGHKSRLTIRLPDISPAISTPVAPPRESARDSSRSRREEPHLATDARPAESPSPASPPPAPSRRAAWAAESWRRTSDGLRGRVVPFVRRAKFRLDGITAVAAQKVVPVVRQPKFWLACITAVAVQVVLAAVTAPPEDEPVEPIRTAANPWRKPAPVPSERIVVPPAQGSHDNVEPTDSGKQGTTTPLGSTAPWDSSEATTSGQPSTEADVADESLQVPRMAENGRLTGDGRRFDGATGEADGATLGRIVPLEPTSDSNLHEPQR